MNKILLSGIYIAFGTLLTAFFADFTFNYMIYFDIGVNNGTRMMEIYLIRIPSVVMTQIITVTLFDKFVSAPHKRLRILLTCTVMMVVFGVVFGAFALYNPGISREGGFIRFLGYYFLGLEPGRVPGSW